MNIFYARSYTRFDDPRPVKLKGEELKAAQELCPGANPNDALRELVGHLSLLPSGEHTERALFDVRGGVPALELAKEKIIVKMLDDLNRAEAAAKHEKEKTSEA